MRLSPLDPSMYGMHGAMAYAHFLAGRYDMASSCAEKVSARQSDFPAGHMHFRSEQCARAGGLTQHNEPCHGHSNVIPICAPPI